MRVLGPGRQPAGILGAERGKDAKTAGAFGKIRRGFLEQSAAAF